MLKALLATVTRNPAAHAVSPAFTDFVTKLQQHNARQYLKPHSRMNAALFTITAASMLPMDQRHISRA